MNRDPQFKRDPKLERAYQAQDDYDDTVVEYAASSDEAGCGCFGCGSTVVLMGLVGVLAAMLAVR